MSVSNKAAELRGQTTSKQQPKPVEPKKEEQLDILADIGMSATSTREPSLYEQYVEHGWKLCAIPAGTKGPRTRGWNKIENAVTAERAKHLESAGLLHAYSGPTCALDIDNEDLARAWLAERGIDLRGLLNAPDAVQITSGNTNHGKLLYRLDTPLPSKKIVVDDLTLLEFRCSDANGGSVQDVLPPSRHPKGTIYEWIGDWRKLPEIPPALLALWQSMVEGTARARTYERDQNTGEGTARGVGLPTRQNTGERTVPAGYVEVINRTDPDCDYDTWRDIGMRLHDYTQGDDAGFDVWNTWSAKSESKYPGEEALRAKWETFGHGSGPQATLEGLGAVATVEDFGPPLTADELDLLTAATEDEVDVLVAELESNLYTLEAIEELPEPPWLVDGLVPAAPLIVHSGESGGGKSFLTLDMCLAIVRGIAWFGNETDKGNVCWIAAEAFESFNKRWRAYRKTHNITTRDAAGFRVLGTGVNLDDKKRIAALTRVAKKQSPKLIVIDTLAKSSGALDENKTADMNRAMQVAERLARDVDTTVLLIHHVGKDPTKGSRGSSVIKAGAYAELITEKHDDETRTTQSTKQRDGEEGHIYQWRLVGVPAVLINTKGQPVGSAVVRFMGRKTEKPTARKKLKLDAVSRAMLAALDEHNGEWSVDEATTQLKSAVGPKPAVGKDRRKETAGNRLNTLVEHAHVDVRDDKVWLTVTGTRALGNPDVEPPPLDPPQAAPTDSDSDLL